MKAVFGPTVSGPASFRPLSLRLVVRTLGAVAALGAVLALASCASSPSAPALGESPFSSLSGGAAAYFRADLHSVMPIAEAAGFAFDKGPYAEAFAATQNVVGAVYPEGSPRRYALAAEGRYPVFRSSLALDFDPAWKQKRAEDGRSYWWSEKRKLSLAFSSRKALLSDGEPFPRGPGPVVPEGFDALSRGAALAGWTDRPAEIAEKVLGPLGSVLRVPADRALFALYPREGGGYRALLRIETASEAEARSFAALLRVASRFAKGSSSPSLALALSFLRGGAETDGSALILRSEDLRAADIALLLPAP